MSSAKKKAPRVNVELRTPEDAQMYHDLKVLAALHGIPLQQIVIPALYDALAVWRRRPLPHQTVVQLTDVSAPDPRKKDE